MGLFDWWLGLGLQGQLVRLGFGLLWAEVRPFNFYQESVWKRPLAVGSTMWIETPVCQLEQQTINLYDGSYTHLKLGR
jgi:hypothetical protein